jgi:hypothetical protein
MKQCDRSSQTEPEPSHLADASWRQAFEEQSSAERIARVHAYAESRARMIEGATQCRDPLLARELVLDALADTFAGVVTWDPQKAPLAAHLCRVIGGRSSHDLARARAYNLVSLDDTMSPSSEAVEEETSNAMAAINDGSEPAHSEPAGTTLAELRRLAARDADVLLLLEALDGGAIERTEVLQITGMEPVDYHNARRRLMRLARRLPLEPSDAVSRRTSRQRGACVPQDWESTKVVSIDSEDRRLCIDFRSAA